jgi:hypothetical protein
MELQMNLHRRQAFLLLLAAALSPIALAQAETHWRPATEAELKQLIPTRAPVIDEHIETELRTASGIADNHGHLIAGVLLITAGYSANGKYSYFLLTQAPIRIGETTLAPGNYLIGWTRTESALTVVLSDATSGHPVVQVEAARNPALHRVESFHIFPPETLSVIQFGRFSFPYTLP